MNLPTATYRIQFRDGMTFDKAASAVPYLKALGISHLYASPIFTATTGSSHGYDIVDCNELDPAIGGREGFERLSDALKQAGLGLILDVVPNHMAASPENAWWMEVLATGERGPRARYFDIDWSEKLTLPILGKSFDEALADGEIRLENDDKGRWCLAYWDTRLPLAEGSAENIADPTDPAAIARVHDAQHYRLMHWKDASRHLSYRRFFEITGLVGLRVEDEEVFEQSHRLILDLVRSGKVDGLRLDHIDGLADPGAYLDRLRAAVGPNTFIVAEKILGPGESLPSRWPIAGTTGYEFIAALSHLFIDPAGLKQFATHYRDLTGEGADFHAGLRTAKSLMIDRNFEGEMARLVRLASSALPHIDPTAIHAALREILIAFPVYRTYASEGPMGTEDRLVLDHVVALAAAELDDHVALDGVARLLRDGSAMEFRGRFQQLSGPVMAKAMEDTLFYRFNRFLGANEVGSEPDFEPGGPARFHSLMLERSRLQPHGLSATSTHDTKRGEDARARLYALSECATEWQQAVEQWRDLNEPARTTLPDGPAPEPSSEWMLYQALAGVWPDGDPDRPATRLTGRFTAYAEKAGREAKLFTDWNDPNEAYETAVRSYAAHLTDPSNAAFRSHFERVMRPLIAAGSLNSLSQTLVKLTAPGIPDIYQGAEALDFSLVDPDNRSPVVMEELGEALDNDGPLSRLPVARFKQRLVRTGLHLRLAQPDLFGVGSYVPLAVSGPRATHVTAFARLHRARFVISVIPRLMLGLIDPDTLLAGPDFWNGTALHLSEDMQGPMQDLLAGLWVEPTADGLSLADLLGHRPVLLMQGTTGSL